MPLYEYKKMLKTALTFQVISLAIFTMGKMIFIVQW